MIPSVAIRIQKIGIELAGVTLTDHSLEIHDEEAFHRAGVALAAMDRYSQWWWGDYLLFAEKFNLRSVLESARSNLHTSTLNSYIATARFFPVKDRFSDLYFNHHASAMYILGGDAKLVEAKKWLAKALAKKWTVGELREAMRTAGRRKEGDPGPMHGVMRITDFAKISRLCSTIRPNDLEAAEVDQIRESTQPLFDFLCEIHRPKFSLPNPT